MGGSVLSYLLLVVVVLESVPFEDDNWVCAFCFCLDAVFLCTKQDLTCFIWQITFVSLLQMTCRMIAFRTS